MPKIDNTIAQRKTQLVNRVTPDWLFEFTSIFRNNPQGLPQLDQHTIDEIKKNFKHHFDSWVKDELHSLIK